MSHVWLHGVGIINCEAPILDKVQSKFWANVPTQIRTEGAGNKKQELLEFKFCLSAVLSVSSWISSIL